MDEKIFAVTWTWGTEAKLFLVKDARDCQEAENDVRYIVGEGGTVRATEVEWGVEVAGFYGPNRRSNLAELM